MIDMYKLIAVLVSLAFSFIFSAAETAFTSLTMIQIAGLKKRKRNTFFIEKLTEKPDELLSTILVGNNIVNILVSILTSDIILERFGNINIALVTGILTFVILIIGEVTPKRIAIAHNETIALAFAPLIYCIAIVFKPIVFIINSTSNIITRIFGKNTRKEISLETFIQMLAIAEHMNIIDKINASMIKNILRLKKTTALSVMTHRKDVVKLDDSISCENAIQEIINKNITWIPVYSKSEELITGVVRLKDIFKMILEGQGHFTLKKIAAQPVFVTQSKSLDDIFNIMKHTREKIVIVMDEYGGFSGIITMQDIIEEIVGELYDKNAPAESRIKRLSDGTYSIAGDTPLVAVLDFFSKNLSEMPPAHTLAGYCAWLLNRIPEKNDKIKTEFGEITITEVRHNRVLSTIVKPLDE
ncbi:MAG TPA: hemolysin family protein [Spirochaetales bacterium]|nr:hemolysin family protein [Spirochaetales bacterium]